MADAMADGIATSYPSLARDVAPAYILLLRAFFQASDAGIDRWQFAIDSHALRARGMHDVDLCWLLNKGFADQAIETTIGCDVVRCFRSSDARFTIPGACYVLTDLGARDLERLCCSLGVAVPVEVAHGSAPLLGAADSHTAGKPRWDIARRELRYLDKLVKRYRVPALNQERILSAFEEEGWPPCIDDPLVPVAEMDAKRRLQATIKSLNRNRIKALITFRGNGNGDRVCWEGARPAKRRSSRESY